MQEHMESADVRQIMAGDYVRPKPAMRQCPDSLTIELPIPDLATHPNARGHWAKLAKARRRQRSDASTAALAMLRCERLTAPCWQRATIQATFHKPGKQSKRSDIDGLISWCKASCDGIQDARIILDDQGLVWLPPIELLGKDAGDERKLVLVITKLD